jgi:hypothetical protein
MDYYDANPTTTQAILEMLPADQLIYRKFKILPSIGCEHYICGCEQ